MTAAFVEMMFKLPQLIFRTHASRCLLVRIAPRVLQHIRGTHEGLCNTIDFMQIGPHDGYRLA